VMSPSEITPNKVAVYIRWSTDDQGEGTTLEVQLERCKHFLVSQGWTFREDLVYIDDGYSGGTLDRPALTRLRADVEDRKIECVVVYKIDRLSRSVVDIVDLVLKQWEGRCFIKSTSEDVNTISPAGKMFFYILVSFAEYERNVIKERTMGGKVKRAEQGLNPGFRPPYGFVKGATPGSFVLVEHEAAVVRRMFDLYRQGNGGKAIADMLNTEGSRRRGVLWNDLVIRRILKNPAYVGSLAYGRTTRTTKSQRDRQGMGSIIRYDQPRYGCVEGAFPAIVDRSVWEEVQRLLEGRKEHYRLNQMKPSYSDYLLVGVGRCRCGGALVGNRVNHNIYYQCASRKRRGKSVCDSGFVRTDVVDAEVEIRVKALLSRETQSAMFRTYEQDLRERMAQVEGAASEAKAGKQALAERATRVEQDYRRGELPARLYAKELEALESDQAAVSDRVQALEASLEELRAAWREREHMLSTVEQINMWDDMTIPERKELLRKLTASVVLYKPVYTADDPVLYLEWLRLGNAVQGVSSKEA